MNGIVKWFDRRKGYGFIIDKDDHEIFIHQTQIKMNGFRFLYSGDIVSFELGEGKGDSLQAINVKPLITLPLIKSALREKGMYCKSKRDSYDSTHWYNVWFVTDEFGTLMSREEGLSIYELAELAGFDVEKELNKTL